MSAQQPNALPLPDYDQLPAGSVEHRIRSLGSDEVQRLLQYEQEHADRPQVEQILTARLDQLESGAEPSEGDARAAGPDVPSDTRASLLPPGTSGRSQRTTAHGPPQIVRLLRPPLRRRLPYTENAWKAPAAHTRNVNGNARPRAPVNPESGGRSASCRRPAEKQTHIETPPEDEPGHRSEYEAHCRTRENGTAKCYSASNSSNCCRSALRGPRTSGPTKSGAADEDLRWAHPGAGVGPSARRGVTTFAPSGRRSTPPGKNRRQPARYQRTAEASSSPAQTSSPHRPLLLTPSQREVEMTIPQRSSTSRRKTPLFVRRASWRFSIRPDG